MQLRITGEWPRRLKMVLFWRMLTAAQIMPGTLAGLPVLNRRKVADDQSFMAFMPRAWHVATMVTTERSEIVRWSCGDKNDLTGAQQGSETATKPERPETTEWLAKVGFRKENGRAVRCCAWR